ncbi:MAG: hypothetical protein ACLP4R_26425 [Solirubrobacteraceae bacterium]
MAVVSGAAFFRASSSLTHTCTGDRRRLIRIHHATAASNTTATPANNPSTTITSLSFHEIHQEIRIKRCSK